MKKCPKYHNSKINMRILNEIDLISNNENWNNKGYNI